MVVVLPGPFGPTKPKTSPAPGGQVEPEHTSAVAVVRGEIRPSDDDAILALAGTAGGPLPVRSFRFDTQRGHDSSDPSVRSSDGNYQWRSWRERTGR